MDSSENSSASESDTSDVSDIESEFSLSENEEDPDIDNEENGESKLILDTNEVDVVGNDVDYISQKKLEVLNEKIITYQVLRPTYQDITSAFDDEVPFLVDGDSLLITVLMDPNYSNQLGGNSLHMIYLFERYLQIFVKRGGTFHLVFLQSWRKIWQHNATILMYRQILIHHFAENTKYPVHLYDNCFDESFNKILAEIRPGFIFTNFGAYGDCKHLLKKAFVFIKHMINIHMLWWLSIDLPCIDTNHLSVDVSLVNGFYLDCNREVKMLIKMYKKKFERFIRDIPQELVDISPITVKTGDIKTIVTILAAETFFNTNKDENMIKILLLTTSITDCLEIRNRCCPKFAKTQPELDTIIENWHHCIYVTLLKLKTSDSDWNTISDLWQGILFGHVLRFTSAGIDCAQKLGKNIADVYENYVQSFNNIGFNIKPYPVGNYNWEMESDVLAPFEYPKELPLLEIKCPLVSEFCTDILSHIKWKEVTEELTAEKVYSEIHHYHTMKVMHDEHDHIADSYGRVPSDPWLKKKYNKLMQQHAKFMTLYGSSLEGKVLENNAIIRNSTSKHDKKEKKQKTSKKAQDIIDQNKKRKDDDLDLQDKKLLDKFEVRLKESDIKLESLLKELNLLIAKLRKGSTNKINALCLKLKFILRASKGKVPLSTIDLRKEIFLTVRTALSLCSAKDLPKPTKEVLVKCLDIIGCNEIAIRNGLSSSSSGSQIDDKWIRYQLEQCGAELERTVLGKPDTRVVGFIPDPWQKQLFDAIDKKESAVIVAPTSSGKTYASYYCMESVLRESTEGIVVYVAPTKALVNQVAATVYARFKDTKMPAGMSAWGVFTRDYRTYAMNCQILVTVPQCLEILLMSPRRHSWVQRLRYVIFDEVHCIAGNLGGLSWERCLLLIRCPFLALSATIRHPEHLHNWLQNAENYKRTRDEIDGCVRKSYRVHIVIHSERHSDLTKFTYGNGEIHHRHPYTDLEESVMNMHQGIPKHMILSPAETIQLFDAMNLANSLSEELKTLSPINYFSKFAETGFITRDLVRKYEKQLCSLLSDWFTNNPDDFNTVVKYLKPKNNDEIVGTGALYIKNEIVEFVLKLKKQNMLPAIVFSYDRHLVEVMAKVMTEYFQHNVKDIDLRVEKKNMKQDKRDMKQLQREAAVKKLDTTTNKKTRPRLNFLSCDPKKCLRGAGIKDSKDIKFIEYRLMRVVKPDGLFVNAIRNGLGWHHAGLNNKQRSAIEMLYQSKFLNLVFATGTLALGIHMPCKTTVVAGNSPYLNSLEYHQMSGRAGRRGYDTAGNVIFFGLNPRKQHTLLTAKLPVLKGNFPITVTQILRLLLLVADVTEKGKASAQVTKQTVSRVMASLEHSLVYTHQPEMKTKLKFFFAFSLQLLKMQELINDEGVPLLWCGLTTHLHYHEPGNLAFVYLLNNGIIRKICTELKNEKDIQFTLTLVFSHLFTRMPLPKAKLEYKNSVVVLDPLPDYVYKALEMYNKQVRFVFDQYFTNVATHSKEIDNVLPLSSVKIIPKTNLETNEPDKDNLKTKFLNMCQPKMVCSSFAALSGNEDDHLYSAETLISNIKPHLYDDIKVIPVINLDAKINGYALDYFRHGIKESIQTDNGLKSGADFHSLQDFMLVLKTVVVSLVEMQVEETDVVYLHMKKLSEKYNELFQLSFPRS